MCEINLIDISKNVEFFIVMLTKFEDKCIAYKY